MDFAELLEHSIQMDQLKISHYRKMAAFRGKGNLNSRHDKRRNKDYFYLQKPGEEKEHPIEERDRDLVWKLQQKAFADAMLSVLQTNLSLKRSLLSKLQPLDESAILNTLPRAYRPNSKFSPSPMQPGKSRRTQMLYVPPSENPFHREDLKIDTSFGIKVRTRGELAIIELLYTLADEYGCELYYERALDLDVIRERVEMTPDGARIIPYHTIKTYYPDFTLILPNGFVIYWEHKGLLKKRSYIERDIQKEQDYNLNKIFQPHNYMVTSDGPDNDLDLAAIKRIIDGWLLPLLAV